MTPSSQSPRTPSRLPDPLHHRLNTYALAASAVGVSLLALVQPSEAKIVYTKTHKIIGTDGLYPLDLNHDGTIDFLIQQQGYPFGSSGNNGLGVKEAFGNAVKGSNFLASALKKDAPIGPRQRFISSTRSFGEIMFNAACSADGGCSTVGKWANVNSRYLGLQFQINGKIHYGWARLNVEVQQQEHTIVATLIGYAYETIPKKEIHAGQTQGADDALTNSDAKTSKLASPIAVALRTLQPASLGQLARGAQYVPPGRRQ